MAEIRKFIEKINVGDNMHSVMMMRGDEVLFEGYWEPFGRETRQRMYSETKSLVGIAIGMLEHEGKLKLDDPLYSFFPDKIDGELPEHFKRQTIRDTLMMSTAVECPSWFKNEDRDRVHLYFNASKVVRAPGTLFTYDSAGTQVLGCLVERLSGMSLLDYIRTKTGLFPTAKMLKTPTGESWSDSSLICTLREMVEFGRFVMQGCPDKISINRLVSPEYLRDATSKLISTDDTGFFSYKALGYGYQIWHGKDDAFCFFGMGNQLTVCVPSKGFIFACTADDQGYAESRRVILDALYEHVIDKLDEPTDVDYRPELKLICAAGCADSPIIPKIDGVRFVAADSGDGHAADEEATHEGKADSGIDLKRTCTPMGIKWFTLKFGSESLEFTYENATGIKKITAGCGKNVFAKFPEEGYSRDVGGERAPGNMYDAAFSYGFETPENLVIRCQIIDEYLGNLSIFFGFRDNYATLRFVKNAEDFLEEYKGVAIFTR